MSSCKTPDYLHSSIQQPTSSCHLLTMTNVDTSQKSLKFAHWNQLNSEPRPKLVKIKRLSTIPLICRCPKSHRLLLIYTNLRQKSGTWCGSEPDQYLSLVNTIFHNMSIYFLGCSCPKYSTGLHDPQIASWTSQFPQFFVSHPHFKLHPATEIPRLHQLKTPTGAHHAIPAPETPRRPRLKISQPSGEPTGEVDNHWMLLLLHGTEDKMQIYDDLCISMWSDRGLFVQVVWSFCCSPLWNGT